MKINAEQEKARGKEASKQQWEGVERKKVLQNDDGNKQQTTTNEME